MTDNKVAPTGDKASVKESAPTPSFDDTDGFGVDSSIDDSDGSIRTEDRLRQMRQAEDGNAGGNESGGGDGGDDDDSNESGEDRSPTPSAPLYKSTRLNGEKI